MTPRLRTAAGTGALLLLTACALSPREDPTTFLVLAPGAAVVPMPAIARPDLRLGVGPVSLPRYLERPQFVTRVDETEITVNEYARWAGPLPRLIAETIAEDLDLYLAPGDVVIHPWPLRDAPGYAVRVSLLHFEVTNADSAQLVGRWDVADREGTVVIPPRVTTLTSAATAADPKAGAMALSRLVGLLSAEIAGELRSLP